MDRTIDLLVTGQPSAIQTSIHYIFHSTPITVSAPLFSVCFYEKTPHPDAMGLVNTPSQLNVKSRFIRYCVMQRLFLYMHISPQRGMSVTFAHSA